MFSAGQAFRVANTPFAGSAIPTAIIAVLGQGAFDPASFLAYVGRGPVLLPVSAINAPHIAMQGA